MAKKWKAIVLAVIVLLVSIKEFVPNEVYAANTIIKVSSQADLKKISKNMFGHYKLSKDIVISEKEWNSIGLSKTNGVAFQGILDGNGHTISGLSSKKGNGLFYEVGKFGTVKNLTLEGKVSASDSDGCAILTRSNSGYLYQVKVKGSRTEANLMAAFAGESQARNKYTYYGRITALIANCVGGKDHKHRKDRNAYLINKKLN